MARRAGLVQLDVEHALGDGAAFAGGQEAGVLDGVFGVEEHAGLGAGVTVINEDGAAAEQVAVTLQREVEGGVEQGVAGADEGGEGLAVGGDAVFLEDDALVAPEHGFADADDAVAVADGGGTCRIS